MCDTVLRRESIIIATLDEQWGAPCSVNEHALSEQAEPLEGVEATVYHPSAIAACILPQVSPGSHILLPGAEPDEARNARFGAACSDLWPVFDMERCSTAVQSSWASMSMAGRRAVHLQVLKAAMVGTVDWSEERSRP